jgi:hypothetical protein
MCINELHINEVFKHHISLSRNSKLINYQEISSVCSGDIFVNIPSTHLVTSNHDRVHAVETILNRFDSIMKNENPARCVIVLSKNDNKDAINFLESVVSRGGILFLEVQKTNLFGYNHVLTDMKILYLLKAIKI